MTSFPRIVAAIPVALLMAATTSGLTVAQEPVRVTDAEGSEVTITDASRVATLGGVVTEIAYALGAEDQIVAVDESSYYPPEARRRGIEGEALVEIRVDRRGVVVEAKIVRSSGSPLLDRAALLVLYDYRFARGDGGRSRVPVNFQLR